MSFTVAAVLLAVLQDESFRIQAELASGEEDGKPIFVVSGMTDLPDGTLVYVDLFRAGTQIGTQLANDSTRVENMGFRKTVRIFPKKNLAGRYYALVRFDLSFQDRKDAGEAIVKSKRKTSAKGEAWTDVGGPGDVDKEYREQCLNLAAEMDAMEALGRKARDEYASLLQGADPIAWKKRIAALKEQVSEIEHRNSDQVENRYFDLTEVADIGLEHLRNQVWALIETYIKAAGSTNPAPAESEARVREDTIGHLVRLLKNKMNLPRTASTDLRTITVDLKGYLDQAIKACQAAEPARARARMVEEHRKMFEQTLMDLAYAVSGDRYGDVDEIARLSAALFDTLTRPQSLEEPASLQDVSGTVEKIEKLIGDLGPKEK